MTERGSKNKLGWSESFEKRYQESLDTEREHLDTGPLGRVLRAASLSQKLRPSS